MCRSKGSSRKRRKKLDRRPGSEIVKCTRGHEWLESDTGPWNRFIITDIDGNAVERCMTCVIEAIESLNLLGKVITDESAPTVVASAVACGEPRDSGKAAQGPDGGETG